jgi:hypothetical protein
MVIAVMRAIVFKGHLRDWRAWNSVRMRNERVWPLSQLYNRWNQWRLHRSKGI